MSVIRIGPIDYTVEYIQDLRDGDRKLDGWFHFASSRILIDESLSEQARRQVLWHEIIHGLFFLAGELPTPERKEDFIDALASGVMNVIRDNPELGQYG